MNDMTDVISNVVNEIIRQERERTERTLAEIITKYDFIVGSKECKCKLMETLTEGANIICSPYIESPTIIYAIKKFDVMDLLFGSQESKEDKSCSNCKSWRLDKNDENRMCRYCFEMDEWAYEKEE